jgi:cell volume regulation protein A
VFRVDGLILAASLLVLFAIGSSKFSSRLGVPVLVVFVGVGMLAGSEGFGGIEFGAFEPAHGIGTIALAVILFDGGLRTSIPAFRAALAPSLTLATLGVVVTAAVTGWAASVLLGMSLLEGMLLGSIVGSTDAAAVFAVLRGKGVHLSERLTSTLEVESGSNDPMAVFLTIALIQLLLGQIEADLSLLALFVRQMAIGGAVGVAVGWAASELINRIDLDAAGLYPVLAAASGLLVFGIAASLGGSGFLAVYLAGIVIGNRRLVFRRGIFLFHDGMAWLAQIVMFTVLGLLSFPSRLIAVAGEGLIVAAVLVFVARPIAVFPVLAAFRYSLREIVLVSWVGLRGAVPIVLATYPLMLGVPDADLYFDVVFFVVLVSVVLQGSSLPFAARALGLQVPGEPEAPVTLEITSLREVQGDIVEYMVGPDSRAAGRTVREMRLPESAVIAMVARGSEIVPPRGRTRILDGDHVFLVLRPEARSIVDRLFGRRPPGMVEEPLPALTFQMKGETKVEDLGTFYGVVVDAPSDMTLAALLADRLGERARAGDSLVIGDVSLRVHEMIGDAIEWVSVGLLAAADEDEEPGDRRPGGREARREPPGADEVDGGPLA